MTVSQVRAELVRRLTCPEEPRSPYVEVTVAGNNVLIIFIKKVSRQGSIQVGVYAKRVEVTGSSGLVGLAARAVAYEMVGREEVATLGLPDTLAEEVVRLVDAMADRSWPLPLPPAPYPLLLPR